MLDSAQVGRPGIQSPVRSNEQAENSRNFNGIA